MATVKNTIALQDKMTPVLRTIIKSLDSTITAMAGVDKISNKAFKQARKDINLATEALQDFRNGADDIPPLANQGANALARWKNPLVTASALIYTIKNAMQGLSSITGVADNFTLTNARLSLMKGEFKDVNDLQDTILASAQRGRAEYDATATSVAKLGLLAKESFGSTEEIVAFSELMNKSFKIGGASIQEQTSGMYQLTQAMASGKLQGDEFRSIMENAPLVADAIAKYTGKSKGELKELSSDGLITSDIIKGAMFDMAGDINTQFETLPMTWGDAWTSVKNQTLEHLQPVIEKLSDIANSEGFNTFINNLINGIGVASGWLLDFITKLEQIASFTKENWPIISDIIISALAGIGTAYIGAQVGALLYAFAQGQVNFQLLLLYARLAGAMVLVAGAVFLWQNFGIVGKILAVILGVLAGVILVATIAQYAFNTSLWACPLVWIIALVIAVIAIIVVLVLWIIDLWQTNMDFKYGVIKIWNSILAFFDQVPIFFQSVAYGIIDAFSFAKEDVLNLMQDLGNGVVQTVNDVIALLNKIPGVAIEPLGELSFGAENAVKAEASRQARANKIASAKEVASAKAAEREAKSDAGRAKDEKNLAEKKAKAEAEKAKAKENKASSSAGTEFDFDKFGAGNKAGNPGVKIDGGKLDKVGRIDDEVSITDEDIKLLKDVAKAEFVNKYTTLRPELKVQFGDVHETADTTKLTEAVETMVVDALGSLLLD